MLKLHHLIMITKLQTDVQSNYHIQLCVCGCRTEVKPEIYRMQANQPSLDFKLQVLFNYSVFSQLDNQDLTTLLSVWLDLTGLSGGRSIESPVLKYK